MATADAAGRCRYPRKPAWTTQGQQAPINDLEINVEFIPASVATWRGEGGLGGQGTLLTLRFPFSEPLALVL